MKKIIILIFIALLGKKCFPQENSKINSQGNIPQKIQQYEEWLENFSSLNNMKSTIENMPINQLKNAARIMFESDEENAKKTLIYLHEKDKEIDSVNSINKKSDKFYNTKVMPNETKWKLLNAIKKNFSNDLYALISVPYFLKISITKIRKYTYEDPKSPAKIPRTDIEATIKEVIKGNSRFTSGDIINFYFMDFWRPTNNDFQEGEIYFVPLAPIREYDCNFELIALVTTLDSKGNPSVSTRNDEVSYGRFPIINNSLIDKNNFWTYGDTIDWNQFKSTLFQKIQLIKSWKGE